MPVYFRAASGKSQLEITGALKAIAKFSYRSDINQTIAANDYLSLRNGAFFTTNSELLRINASENGIECLEKGTLELLWETKTIDGKRQQIVIADVLLQETNGATLNSFVNASDVYEVFAGQSGQIKNPSGASCLVNRYSLTARLLV